MVGSAIHRNLTHKGYTNIIFRSLEELDLTNQQATSKFFGKEKPEYVFLAAAKVGGIIANNTYRADFIYQNIQIQNNIIHQSYLNGVKNYYENKSINEWGKNVDVFKNRLNKLIDKEKDPELIEQIRKGLHPKTVCELMKEQLN